MPYFAIIKSAIQNKKYNTMRYELFKIEKIYSNHNRYDMGDKVVIKKKNLSLIQFYAIISELLMRQTLNEREKKETRKDYN